MGLQERVETAIARVEEAAFDLGAWDEALRAIAAATGSRHAQLIAIGGRDGSLFNRMPDADPERIGHWIESGFDRPAVNSRIRIGSQAPLMRSLDERAFTTELDKRLDPAYGDAVDRLDLAFACTVNLLREPDLSLGMAVLRGREQGNIDARHRRVFDLLARHVRQAVRCARAMGMEAANATAHGFEAIGMPAFVCDVAGRVLAANAGAEALLAGGRLLRVGGRLYARGRVPGARGRCDLSEWAGAVASGRLGPDGPIVLRDADGRDALVVEMTPLPGRTPGFPGAPGALILVRHGGRGVGERLERRIVALHGLTPREAQVAVALCGGQSPQAVASALGMGVGTVRTHVRRLFDKTGAGSLAQLVALLRGHDV